LLIENFKGLGAISKLVHLVEDLGCVRFELGLQNFDRLLLTQLFAHYHAWFLAKERVNLGEQSLRRPASAFKVRQNALL